MILPDPVSPLNLWRPPAIDVIRVGALSIALLVAEPLVQAAPIGDPTAHFYDPDSVQIIDLEIARLDLDRMQRALPQRISVPGTFRWNGQTYGDVGIRYKGDSSADPASPFKRSFLIEVSKFKAGQRFLGLRHIALDNAIQFGSIFSERLITDVLRGEGVKASRCNYARVYLNGQPAGLYVNVERIDRSFLERNFASAKGPLFKVDHGGPGADFRYVGADPTPYQQTFELHSGKESKAYGALVDFIHLLDTPTISTTALRQELDLDSFIKTTAVMLFSGAFDQYTGWGPHNYYLYANPSDHRWTYIPWDLDVGFADEAFGRVPVLQGWNAAWPVPVPGRPLMERLVSDPILLQEYRQQARRILEKWFRPDTLIPKLRALYVQALPALREDPYPPRRATVPSDSGYEDILTSMADFIRNRYALASAQLDAPGNRPKPTPLRAGGGEEGPKPGPPSADAPSDLRAVEITPRAVALRWTDHTQGAVAVVVQRCTGTDCTNFVNTIGQGGANVTMATDRQVKPGTTYRYRVYAVLPTPQGPKGTGVSNVLSVTVPDDSVSP